MKYILVPFDFSPAAINAYRFSLELAARTSTSVYLLHVIEYPAIPNTITTPARSLGKEQMRKHASIAREKMMAMLKRYPGNEIKVFFKIEFGPVRKIILTCAATRPIKMIVMGSHGSAGIKDYFIGSNAEKIIRTSPVPVLIVKSFYKGPVENIVFPVDPGATDQKDLVENVKELQSLFGSHLHLLRVNTPANFTDDRTAFKKLNDFAHRYAIRNYSVSVFNNIYEEQGILDFAEQVDADLIAMGTHGRKGITHWALGSKTENVAGKGPFLIWTSVMKKAS